MEIFSLSEDKDALTEALFPTPAVYAAPAFRYFAVFTDQYTALFDNRSRGYAILCMRNAGPQDRIIKRSVQVRHLVDVTDRVDNTIFTIVSKLISEHKSQVKFEAEVPSNLFEALKISGASRPSNEVNDLGSPVSLAISSNKEEIKQVREEAKGLLFQCQSIIFADPSRPSVEEMMQFQSDVISLFELAVKNNMNVSNTAFTQIRNILAKPAKNATFPKSLDLQKPLIIQQGPKGSDGKMYFRYTLGYLLNSVYSTLSSLASIKGGIRKADVLIGTSPPKERSAQRLVVLDDPEVLSKVTPQDLQIPGQVEIMSQEDKSRVSSAGLDFKFDRNGFYYRVVSPSLSGARLLYHGSRNQTYPSIIQHGFRVGTSGMFGGGVYFASEADKSLGYTMGRNIRFLLICEVALGHYLDIYGKDRAIGAKFPNSGAQTNLKWLKSHGFDSVYASKGRTLRRDEFIVYSPAQCVPRFLVSVGEGKGRWT